MSRRSKYSVEEKVKTAEACLSGQMWISEASHRTGADEKNIRRWISRYKSEGASAFLPSEHNRTYPAELKRQAVEEYLAGKGSLQDVCEKYKIRSDAQLRNWIKVYNRHEDFKRHSGGSRMTKSRKTSREERQKIEDRKGMPGKREELRRNRAEIQCQLSAGLYMGKEIQPDG